MNFKNILWMTSFIIVSFSNLFAQVDTILINVTPADAGSVIGDGTYPSGTLVNLKAIPNIGYSFVNWTENGLEQSTDSLYSFNSVGNTILSANFVKKSYLIDANSLPIEGGLVSGAGTYIHESTADLEAIPNIGYSFVNWTENGLEQSTDSLYSFIVGSNRNLTANFEIISYLIESSVEPFGSGTVIGSGNHDHGVIVNLEALPNFGYTFINWTENGLEISTDSLYSFIVGSNRNLTANFEIISYLIESSVEPFGSGTVIGSGNHDHGVIVNLEALPNFGYTFINWTENGLELSTDSIFTFSAEESRSLVANFTLNNYTVLTNSVPIIGGITVGSGSFIHGDFVTVIATPASGYFFKHWTENDTVVSTDSLHSFNILSNRNLTAIFTEKEFIVSTIINPPLSGTTFGDSSYTNLTLVNVIATPNNGWEFNYWSENGNILSVDSSYSFVIFKDKYLTANFSKLIYNLQVYSSPINGGIVVGEGFYTHDSLVTVTAYPSPGWQFVNWTENGEIISTDSLFTFNLLNERTLVANFSKKLFTISTTPNPINAGTTYGDSLYTFGDNASIMAIADSNSGWEFSHWSENSTQLSNDINYSIIADTNRNIIANFQLKNYVVNLSTFPDDAGLVDGLGTYTHGDSVTINATPQEGWFFANWSDGNNNVSDQADHKFLIDDNKTLIANFAHELYSLNSTVEPSEAGYVSGAGTFYYNQSANLTPIANPGWEFENWTENDIEISSDSLLSLSITKDMNIKANFKMVNYSINCSVYPLDAGITTGCGISRYNQQMILSATPNKGWEFENWTENGDTVSTLLNYNFTVTNHRNVIANFQLVTTIDLLKNQNIVPSEFYLSNAYPNPFNPSTNINFGLPVSAIVNIIISNINGEAVQTIVDDKQLSAGSYSERFNAENLSSGIYFYFITAQADNNEQSFRKVGKMILLK